MIVSETYGLYRQKKEPAMPVQTAIVLVALQFETEADDLDLAEAVHARLDEVYPSHSSRVWPVTPIARRVVAGPPDVLGHVLSAAEVSLDGGPAEDDEALLEAAWRAIVHLQAVGHATAPDAIAVAKEV